MIFRRVLELAFMPSPRTPRDPNQSIHTLLNQIEAEHFYGTVSVRYEDGTAVHVRKEQSILPSNITLTETPEHHANQHKSH